MKPCTCSDYQHVGCRGEAGLGEGWYCVDKHPNGPPPKPTPPADHRSTLRALVEAGEKAPTGPYRVGWGMPGATSTWASACPPGSTIVTAPAGSFVLGQSIAAFENPRTADFAVLCANARPALAAIAGKVWLEPEVVRTLIDATQDFRDSFERETGLVATNSRAALAAAEAELRATEER